MLEIALSEPATRGSYAEWMQSPDGLRAVKKKPDSQEGSKTGEKDVYLAEES